MVPAGLTEVDELATGAVWDAAEEAGTDGAMELEAAEVRTTEVEATEVGATVHPP